MSDHLSPAGSAVFTPRAGRRRRWQPDDALATKGPICTSVLDVKDAVRRAVNQLEICRRLLHFSVRDSKESGIRAALFYFWCKHTGVASEAECSDAVSLERPLAPWEATLNCVDALQHAKVIDEVRSYVLALRQRGDVGVVARLEHLERIAFHARRLAQIAKEVTPADPERVARDTVSPWLADVSVFCQSDKVQKLCRETYLMLNVSPYEMEASESPNAFSCLCTTANDRVNTLVERASAPLQAIVKAGPESQPHIFFLAALCVFCEFVRCKRALDTHVHTLYDAEDAKPGSFLVEKSDRIYIRTLHRGTEHWEGPYPSAGPVMTRWEEIHGATSREDLV